MLRVVFLMLLCSGIQASGQSARTIRGNVVDNVLSEPVAFATVVVLNADPALGATTDSSGNFTIASVPVGRYDIRVSCAGYEPVIIREVMVGSIKENHLAVRLKQRMAQLHEIVVKPGISKQNPLNETATISAGMLSVEEARRYAGGFDDPARLVSAFAGVSGNVGNNAVIVRGNSPQSLQWKLEGIEIPNPNHLADMRAFGGGTVTALSAQLLANSDFFSGAMPAEYSNALSGVFDMAMRIGNNQKKEHTFQVGVVGIDVASEGPFKQGGKSSYLFNYRYSTLAIVGPLLADNAGGIKYQDLSFKLNFPTKKSGTFSLWGLGLMDRVGAEAKQDTRQWVYADDRENHHIQQHTGAAGASHRLRLNEKQYVKSTLAITLNGIHYLVERLDSNWTINPQSLLNNSYSHFVLSSSMYTKFNKRHSNKTGFTLTTMQYDFLLQNDFRSSSSRRYVARERGNSTLISAYTHSTFHPGGQTTLNAGVNTQVFTLNNRYSVEPRIGIKHRIFNKHTLGFAYGLHSRLERLNYYFIRNSSDQVVNKNLAPSKAHHLVLGYDMNTSEFTHLKAEMYYQHLFHVPVIADSSFSMLNMQNDWFLNLPLQNLGKGRNYGVDITFEKYLSRGYYYMGTASLFRALYLGGDGIWRNTRYSRNFAFNFLIGKEWFLGKDKQNVLGANARVNYQGGDRHSPVNNTLSIKNQAVIFDETKAFSMQYPASITGHVTLSYKMNKKRVAHEIALKIINLTQYKEYVGFRYNYHAKSVEVHREPVVVPNLSYRIDF